MDRRGAALLIVTIIIVLVIIIVASLMPQVVNQRQTTQRSAHSIRALYAAESGINRAVQDLNTPDFTAWTIVGSTYTLPLQPLVDNNGDTIAFYEVVMTEDLSDPVDPVYTAESTGYSPTQTDAERSISSIIRRMEAAIVSKGGIEQGGDATITGPDPEEDYVEDYTNFLFANIFGDTMANVKVDPNTQVIVNPVNNYMPVPDCTEAYTDVNVNNRYDLGEPFVDGNGNGVCDEYRVTWFEVPDGGKAKLSDILWIGAGLDDVTGLLDDGTILVVEGDIEFTGGVFYGALYVIGNMTFAAGNADIHGTIFVDGTVDSMTEVKGTTNITYDPARLVEAFGYNPMPFARETWAEIYK
jgi:type II secretory pathway pseudopilin PulG